MYGRKNKLEFCTFRICLTEKHCEHALPGCSAVLNQMEPSQCVPLSSSRVDERTTSGMFSQRKQGTRNPWLHVDL